MSRARLLWLAVGALACISVALLLATRRNASSPPSAQGPLLPALAGELDTVSSVSVRKGGPQPAVTVHKVGGQWTVAERAEYPADVPKLRKLLLALADAKILEEKTSNPENFAVIGVEDPGHAGAVGAEITVTARDGSHALIIGKPAAGGNFARRGGENQTYVVGPAISFESEPRYWIDPKLLDVPAASIQRIEIKPAGGAAYGVRRVKPNEDSFVLEGAPSGRTAADSRTLAPSPTALSGLSADDVSGAGDVDFSKPTEAIITLADGNVLTLTGSVVGEKHWIEVKSAKDPALTAKTAGRAFEVASYRYEAIFRPLEQLLVPKPPPDKQKKPPAPKP